jgi:mannose-6-phosphate isomerase-like protein (cupin superfamily)
MHEEIVKKPWGEESILHITDKTKLKYISVKKDEALSLQYHEKKREFIVCISGEVLIQVENDVFKCKENDNFFVDVNKKHRIVAITDVEIVELSVGDDSDIIRIEDKYGRTTKV